MPGGTENSASTKMRKTVSLGDGAGDDDDDVEPGDSVSAAGKPKGGEIQKVVGAMFDSMIPLKSKKSKSKRSSSDSDGDGTAKKKRRSITNGNTRTGEVNAEARGYYSGRAELINQSSHMLDFQSFHVVSARNSFPPMIKRIRLEDKLYKACLS